MSKFEIKKLSDREHIIKRPSMYIGSISNEESEELVLTDNSAQQKTLTYPPALVKIINEVLDNSVDAILKTKIGNEVSVTIESQSVSISDNSAGFPSPKNPKDAENAPMVLALGNARAGSNFNDDDNIGQIGTNGVGAFATNCFSKSFNVISKNTNSQQTAAWKNNAEFVGYDYKAKSNSKTGTTVEFEPDLQRFGLSEISEDVKEVVKSRMLMLALTYPKIKFIFNKELLKVKHISDLFVDESTPNVAFKTDNYEVLVLAKSEKTSHFSFVNGLNTKDGGTHIDVILGDIIKELSTVKGLNATKADINNTLQIVFVGKGWKNLRFNSQTKEKITNSTKETREYLGDLDSLVQKVKKSKEIKEFIKATTSARELRSEKKALKEAKRTKIKSEKFLDAQGDRKILMIVEGDSAMGGLVPALGRQGIAYYALKGKPLNAHKSSTQKVAANKELSELLAILHQSDFEKVVAATDQDLDGLHIRGLLTGFINRFVPELKESFYFLQTPVRLVFKGEKPVRWSYNLEEDLKIKSGETPFYMKGLGSWDAEALKEVVKYDGIDQILQQADMRDARFTETLEAWLGDDADKRKELILKNDFSIAKI